MILNLSMSRRPLVAMLICALSAISALAGEVVTTGELTALKRAISREASSTNYDPQTLADLTRLQAKLIQMNASVGAPAGASAEDPSRQLLAHLMQAAGKGAGRAERRALAYYYLYLNEPEKAMEQWKLAGSSGQTDLVYPLVSGLLNIVLGELTLARRDLEMTLSSLEARLPLRIGSLVFCRTIAGYREAIPRDPGPLLPGEDVLVYAEVEGAQFQSLAGGGADCELEFSIKILDDEQRTVWAEPNFGVYSPEFMGPIRDLHTALTLRIPNDLAAGRYQLVIDVMEPRSNRRGSAAIGFDVKKRPTAQETRPTSLSADSPLFTGPKAPTPPTLPRDPKTIMTPEELRILEQIDDKEKRDVIRREFERQRQ